MENADDITIGCVFVLLNFYFLIVLSSNKKDNDLIAINSRGEGFKIANFFFQCKEDIWFSVFVPSDFITRPHFLIIHFFFFFTFDYPFLTGKLGPCTFYYTKGSYYLSDPVSNP